MNSAEEDAVVNASPLICLGKAGMLDVFLSAYDQIFIPQQVAAEITAGPENDPARLFIERGQQFRTIANLAISDIVKEWDLGAGESSVLEYASQHPPMIAIIDDAAARRCARTLNVRYSGSLGVVLKAHKLGILKNMPDALSALKDAGLYVTQDVLERLQRI